MLLALIGPVYACGSLGRSTFLGSEDVCQAQVLRHMASVSSAELEGWTEQVERLQLRKKAASQTYLQQI